MKTTGASDPHAKGARTSVRAAKRPASSGLKNETTPSIRPEAGSVVPEQRYQMIAKAAYFRAERRGFASGFELQDWLEAEAEVDRVLLETGGEAGSAHAFEDALEARLKGWDEKFDALMGLAEKAKTEARHELEEQLEALGAKRAMAQEKLEDLRQRTGSAWADFKEGAEQAWEDIRKALDSVASRFK